MATVVRFFFPVPFFFGRVTLIGSGVLVRTSSPGTSYGGNDDSRTGAGVWLSEGAGVPCLEIGADDWLETTAPSGISPSLSITNAVDENV